MGQAKGPSFLLRLISQEVIIAKTDHLIIKFEVEASTSNLVECRVPKKADRDLYVGNLELILKIFTATLQQSRISKQPQVN